MVCWPLFQSFEFNSGRSAWCWTGRRSLVGRQALAVFEGRTKKRGGTPGEKAAMIRALRPGFMVCLPIGGMLDRWAPTSSRSLAFGCVSLGYGSGRSGSGMVLDRTKEHGLMARSARGSSGFRGSRAGNLLKRRTKRKGRRTRGTEKAAMIRRPSPVFGGSVPLSVRRCPNGGHISPLVARKPANQTSRIHHSDQGLTYTGSGYRGWTQAAKPASPLPANRATMPTWKARTVAVEEVDRNRYGSFLEAQASLEHFIDAIYNQQRMHSSLEYMSPDQFESRPTKEAR